MTAVILLVIIIVASIVCVRAGGIALELTGMEASRAHFQALSAFTNCGFTTRETEDVVQVPVRRRIISVLIILGYAGTASAVGTFAMSIMQRDLLLLLRNVGLIGLALFILYQLARVRGLTQRAGEALRRWLMGHYHFETASIEEILRVAEGFGVVRVLVPDGSPLLRRPLQDLALQGRKIQILAIHRASGTITVPQGSDRLEVGDHLVCYGDKATIREIFGQAFTVHLAAVSRQ